MKSTMASITPSSKKSDLTAWCLGFILLAWAVSAFAQGILVKSAELVENSGDYHLSANFEVDLTPTLEDALNKGLPLYFLVEFDLIYPRWYTLYLWNQRLVEFDQVYRLSYNALTRQYRLSYGALHQNIDTLDEALALLGRLRGRRLFSASDLVEGRVYEAQIRMRLDTAQLPKPFQITALASRDWTLVSDWFLWTVMR
jgi:hypothetical protein